MRDSAMQGTLRKPFGTSMVAKAAEHGTQERHVPSWESEAGMGQSEVAQPRSLALGRLGAGGGSPSPVAKPDQKIVDRGDQTRLDPLDCQIRMGPTERRKKFGKREWQV